MGNKWSEIAKCIPGRTQNSVKNRFNSLAKKERTKLQELTKVKNNKKADNTIDLKSSMNSFFKVKQCNGSHQIWIKPLLTSLLAQYKAKHNSDYDMNKCPESELKWQHSQQILDNEENQGDDQENDDQEEDEDEDDDEDEQQDQEESGDQNDDKKNENNYEENKRDLIGQNKRTKAKKQKKENEAEQNKKNNQQVASQPLVNELDISEALVQGNLYNQQMKNYILAQQQQQQVHGDGNLLLPPSDLMMQPGFQLNRKDRGQQIVTGGGIVIRSGNPSGSQTPLHTLEYLAKEGKINLPQTHRNISSSVTIQQRRGNNIYRGNSERETQLMLQKYRTESEILQKQQNQLLKNDQNQGLKIPPILINSEPSNIKLQNMPYYKKDSNISSDGRITFASSDYNQFKDNATVSTKGNRSNFNQLVQSIRSRQNPLQEVTRAAILENGEKFVNNQNFNMSIYVTSDAIYLDQGNEIIKLADIGSNSSASSVKSNNSGELLQTRKYLELDKVELATVATNQAQRGSFLTQNKDQKSQTDKDMVVQQIKQNQKKGQLDEEKQKESSANQKTENNQTFIQMNSKQKQQSFRRGSSSVFSNKRSSLTPMHFDQLSQKRNSFKYSYPNFFATGPTPKESKKCSSMSIGANIGVPFQDFLDNFQSNGFLDPKTPLENFQDRSNYTKGLASNLAGNTNQSDNLKDSNFNTAAAAAVANSKNKLTNSTPICSSNRLPMRVTSSNQVHRASDQVVQPKNFMAAFVGQPLDEYMNAQQRISINEMQLRGQNRNYTNKTAPSCDQENQSISQINYSHNPTQSINAEIAPIYSAPQRIDAPSPHPHPQNNDFGGMFGPLTQISKPQNNPDFQKQISDLNFNTLSLFNKNSLNQSLQIFPAPNESILPADSNNQVINQSVYNRNGLFMNQSIFCNTSDNRASIIANIVQNPQHNMLIDKIADQVKSLHHRSWPASNAGDSVKFINTNNNLADNMGYLKDNGLDVRSLSDLSAPFQPYSAPPQLFQIQKQSQYSLAGLLSANQNLGGGNFQLNSQKGGAGGSISETNQ